MILAGDVGGTKVHLALYDFTNGKLVYSRDARYQAKIYSGLEEIVKEFLGAERVTAACFGVPGPVRNGRLRLTNLPWTLDSHELSTALGITPRHVQSAYEDPVHWMLEEGRLPVNVVMGAPGFNCATNA